MNDKWHNRLRDGSHRDTDKSTAIPEHAESLSPRQSVSDMPTRICTGFCGRELPNTAEFFYYLGRPKYGDLLAPKCKDCAKNLYNADGTRKPQRVPAPPKPPVIEPTHKRCTRCFSYFPATEEYFHVNGDRLRAQCKSCYLQSTAKNRSNRTGKPARTRAASSVLQLEAGDLRRIVELLDKHQIPAGSDVVRRVEIALNQRHSFGVLAVDKSRARVSGDDSER